MKKVQYFLLFLVSLTVGLVIPFVGEKSWNTVIGKLSFPVAIEALSTFAITFLAVTAIIFWDLLRKEEVRTSLASLIAVSIIFSILIKIITVALFVGVLVGLIMFLFVFMINKNIDVNENKKIDQMETFFTRKFPKFTFLLKKLDNGLNKIM